MISILWNCWVYIMSILWNWSISEFICLLKLLFKSLSFISRYISLKIKLKFLTIMMTISLWDSVIFCFIYFEVSYKWRENHNCSIFLVDFLFLNMYCLCPFIAFSLHFVLSTWTFFRFSALIFIFFCVTLFLWNTNKQGDFNLFYIFY